MITFCLNLITTNFLVMQSWRIITETLFCEILLLTDFLLIIRFSWNKIKYIY
jgi:hypothetical protein